MYVDNIAVGLAFSSLMFDCVSVSSSNLLLEKECSDMLSISDGNVWFYSKRGHIKFLFVWVFFLSSFDCKNINCFTLFTLFRLRSSDTFPCPNIKCVIVFSIEELYKMYDIYSCSSQYPVLMLTSKAIHTITTWKDSKGFYFFFSSIKLLFCCEYCKVLNSILIKGIPSYFKN